MKIIKLLCQKCNIHTIVNLEKENIFCKNCHISLGTVQDFDGYVYVIYSPLMPDILKIGMTTRNVKDRVKELSTSTGVPTEFKILASFLCKDAYKCEQIVHKKLNSVRLERKEFFHATYEQAKEAILSTDLTIDLIEYSKNIHNFKKRKPAQSTFTNLEENICPKCNIEMRTLKKGGFKCRKCGSLFRK